MNVMGAPLGCECEVKWKFYCEQTSQPKPGKRALLGGGEKLAPNVGEDTETFGFVCDEKLLNARGCH